jgi:hypothetical protein
MKLPESLQPSRLFAKNRRGVALITVLTVIALTTILVLTFFTLATSEHRASNTYSQGLHAQQVAEQAVNLVIAQIREATVRPPNSAPVAWASQPGAIRLWTQNGGRGPAYKLYSDDLMKTADWADFSRDFEDSSNWSARPDHFVDLNEPVIRGEKVYYPIVHPNASTEPRWPKQFGDDSDGVEGFFYNGQNGRGGDSLADEGPIGGNAARVANAQNGHVAMPVRWIYQLADGTLGVLEDSAAGGSGNGGFRFRAFPGGGAPSARNPIVARFAFWADDETTKLNINTHAGGLAWDIPRAGGDLDMQMGMNQPAQKEWQRYPGHPASTHLLPVLAPGVVDIVDDREAMEMLFNVVPRVVGGGSESGTRKIDTRNPKEMNGLLADTEPLFPTLDDMMMRGDRTPHQFPDPTGRPIPEDQLAEYLERSKFFLTANSRAPETNLFNKPKIAMWPVFNADFKSRRYQSHLTAFDRLIHYCASVGRNAAGTYPRFEYIFKRQQADSEVFDYESIPRNRDLYQYLLASLTTDIPGYGASFVDKYGQASAAQLATMMFDYIRCTNLHDDTLYNLDFAQAFKTRNTANHPTFTNPRDGNVNNMGFGHKGHGQVTPIRIQSGGQVTKGLGRFCTLSSAAVIVASVASYDDSKGGVYEAGLRYPGTNSHYARHAQPAGGGPAFSNLPPLPPRVTSAGRRTPISVNGTSIMNDPRDATSGKAAWPQWLKELEVSALGLDPLPPVGGPVPAGTAVNPTVLAEVDAAFDQGQWNWQLAYLDPAYRAAVQANPTDAKFNVQSLNATPVEEMRLRPNERLVQSIFVFNLYCPSLGWASINPDMVVEIRRMTGGMNFAGVNGTFGFLGFDQPGWYTALNPKANATPGAFVWATNWVKPVQESGARAYGGLLPFTFTFSGREQHGETGPNASAGVGTQLWNFPSNRFRISSPAVKSRLTPLDRGYNLLTDAVNRVRAIREIGGQPADVAQSYRYDLITEPFKIDATTGVAFTGGDVKFTFFDGDKTVCENSFQDDGDRRSLVQEITLNFPNFRFDVNQLRTTGGTPGYVNEYDDLSSDSSGHLELTSLSADPANPEDSPAFSSHMRGGTWRNTVRPSIPATSFIRPNNDLGRVNVRGRMTDAALHWHGPFIRPGDIVQSVAVPHGDIRVVASRAVIEPSSKQGFFEPHRNYGSAPMAHSFTNGDGAAMVGYDPTRDRDFLIVADLPPNVPNGRNIQPYRGRSPLPFPGKETSKQVQRYGDFDNGPGLMIDGPYINKPDEGNVHSLRTRFTQEVVNYWERRRLEAHGEYPYFSSPQYAESGGPAYFSPNRLVSGPGMFGSLPTSLFSDPPRPWQTLLFRPNVVGNDFATHPGAGARQGGQDPPDHLIMDLFWMPVVEPYAISEPLSTGGKVNLNYEIMPFLHIHRDTALRGVFRSEFMVCIPNRWHGSYKHEFGRGQGYHWKDAPSGGALQGKRLRAVILDDPTLAQFKARFNRGQDVFKSATEICEIHLVPQEFAERIGRGGGSIGSYTPEVNRQSGRVPDMENGKYWRDHSLVGDNSRERPYTNIHNRLTTKSNTFLVHYRAQVIKQARRDNDGDYAEWRPTTDTIQAEYRGSSLVERYVDPNDAMRDFAAPGADPIDEFYRFRVVNPRRFAP